MKRDACTIKSLRRYKRQRVDSDQIVFAECESGRARLFPVRTFEACYFSRCASRCISQIRSLIPRTRHVPKMWEAVQRASPGRVPDDHWVLMAFRADCAQTAGRACSFSTLKARYSIATFASRTFRSTPTYIIQREGECLLAKPNYRQQKKQREQAKKKKNDEKLQRRGRTAPPSVNEQERSP